MDSTRKPVERVSFSKIPKVIDMPDLIEVQKSSYVEFLQEGISEEDRTVKGLEEVFREIFPITDFNETSVLEYLSYTLEKPKYTPREAIDRSTTFAAPLKVKVRLVNYDVNEETGEKLVVSAKESEVYLCDVPLMTDRGTFVINGVERVIVNQLHRSPGIFFEDITASKSVVEKHLFSARIIPYRGSWIDFDFDAKNIMYVRIDKKRKIPVTVLLKALGMSEKQILETYYDMVHIVVAQDGSMTKEFNQERLIGQRNSLDIKDENGEIVVKANHKITKAARKRLIKAGISRIPVQFEDIQHTFFSDDLVDSDGEVVIESNSPVTEEALEKLAESGINEFRLLFIDKATADSVIRDILATDKVKSEEDALIEIYRKLRPGEPATEDTSRALFDNLFFNPKRYDLSRVGRLKINKRLGLDTDLDHTTLSKDDIVETVRVLENIRKGTDNVDDIDHLGHRRVRAAGEQLQNHIRIGLSRMEKTVKERMSIQDIEDLTPQDLLNAKPLSASIKEFFGSYQLSQFMDQTNPLSEITHKRRLSALGPGGLNRDRAGFEVRDVHTSHYGRICPIETPEGPNIGLITSLTTFAKINEFGFIETPYRKVEDGHVTEEVVYMSAIEEEDYTIAQANAPLDENRNFIREYVAARHKGESLQTPKENIDYMDVSPKQIVSVSSALIPFLEHDDANRALMGSNMQRQGVPLIRTDSPIVGTGLERKVAVDSGAVVIADHEGVVDYIDAVKIVVRYEDGRDFGVDVYDLVKYRRSNQDTCINFKPIVDKGEHVKKGAILAGGPATQGGELALGKNVVLAFMPWMGYNYEDSILISEKLVKEDAYTSIHIEVFEVEARDTKLGPEEITSDIPNVSDEALKDLDESGIIRVGAKVRPGDILVGKVTPKGETQATPEEKLLRAIFGEKAGDVKDASLRVPPSITGTIVDVQVMTRRGIEKDGRTEEIENHEHEDLNKEYERMLNSLEKARKSRIIHLLAGRKVTEDYTSGDCSIKEGTVLEEDFLTELDYSDFMNLPVEDKRSFEEELVTINNVYFEKVRDTEDLYKDKKKKVEKGDELPAGVLKSVKVYVAIKRKLSVGDKMAGRHGNKGVVSRVLPEEDMPYLPDGTPVEIVLNPLSVPSRMNIGQVLETHLGWAARALGFKVATEVFDSAREEDIKEMLARAGFQEDGQTILYDGRTGERFDQEVTVGIMYVLKLHHLVDTKIHARSTGPYSLVTQQPLGGKAQFGGQRLGEMEVWALEAYGAANILQEMLTVKSDDVEGRTTVYEAIVNGNFSFSPSMPESFNVLIKELQGLALDIELKTGKDIEEEEAAASEEDDIDIDVDASGREDV
ncbi:DNA-directed RNA polymerase subunit beta [Limisalsivibrio acetivorans]|uniref:DNA-directed RNA polymerase subunit beta n=1 Tax=Limisalsivibrio acetivorans TaxID=1304888 RepID=UPI000685563A|nr:DNA-directed RNA polymerase subunit beta [Limisalsivibrio acetivorans]